MSFDQGLVDFEFGLLDQDFLLDYEKGNAGSDRFNVDDIIFDQEPKNPLFGNDLSLASTLNLSSDDHLLACAPTDVYPLEEFQKVEGIAVERKQSPWHGSDSGMSDTSPSSSPQRSVQEEVNISGSSTTLQQKLTNMDVLDVNVEDLDFDIDQYSPSSSYTSSPTHSATAEVSKVNDDNDNLILSNFVTDEDLQQKQALEFFNSADIFSNKPKTFKLVKVQNVDVPEEKSRKNAIQAKINREKKKAYIKNLEDEISTLRSDNAKLKSENMKMQSNVSELEEEVEYLKSVLVNSSSLSGLLKNISNVNEVKLSATLVGKKRSISEDHSYNYIESVPQKRARRINDNLKKAGVCLHVNGGSACLEFCAHCAKLAHKTSLS